MTWSEGNEKDALSLAVLLAPYKVKSARIARALVRLSVRCTRRGQR